MERKILSNIKNNFRLYLQSKLLLVLGIILVVFYGVNFIPSLMGSSVSVKLSGLTNTVNSLSSFAAMFSAALVLIGMHYPLKERCIKMIITKPCPLWIWTLSNVLSALLVSLLLHLITFLITFSLMLSWGLGFEPGMLFITFNNFLRSTITISYALLLMSFIGPWGTAVFILFLTESWLYTASNLLLAINEATSNVFALIFHKITYFIYASVPMLKPFSEKLSDVYFDFSFSGGEMKYLGLTLGYAFLIGLIAQFASTIYLNNKRLT